MQRLSQLERTTKIIADNINAECLDFWNWVVHIFLQVSHAAEREREEDVYTRASNDVSVEASGKTPDTTDTMVSATCAKTAQATH